MFKRKIILIIILVSVVAIALSVRSGYFSTKSPGGEKAYTIIDTDSAEFINLNKDQFKDWYENKQVIEGVHTLTLQDVTYLLVCAGERPTGGYQLENIVLHDNDNEIRVIAVVKSPPDPQMEAKRATFPHSLLAIPKENKRIVLGFLDTVEESELEEKTDTGTFIKRVDLNSVEIRISGVPEEIPPRIFLLYETVNDSFDSMGFKEGDAVRFIYSKNIENKLIITDIEKMNDAPLE